MQKFLGFFLIGLYLIILLTSIIFCGISFRYPVKYENYIDYVCDSFDLSKHTFFTIINTESGFDKYAVSFVGAIGLTQLMPSTAEYICIKNNIDFNQIDLYDEFDNLYIGGMYLRYLLDKFSNKYTAICAYNAGETSVRSWLKNPEYSIDGSTLVNIPYKETKNYIKKIKNGEKIYKYFYKFK